MIKIPRVIAGMLLLAIFFGWLYAALLPWRAYQLAEGVKSGVIPPRAVPSLRWADEAPRVAAQNLLWSGSGNEQIIEDYLRRSIIARPLYAPTWLNRAEHALRMGDREAADHYGDVARTLWPTRNSSSMCSSSAGSHLPASTALTTWAVHFPEDSLLAYGFIIH